MLQKQRGFVFRNAAQSEIIPFIIGKLDAPTSMQRSTCSSVLSDSRELRAASWAIFYDEVTRVTVITGDLAKSFTRVLHALHTRRPPFKIKTVFGKLLLKVILGNDSYFTAEKER